MQVSPVCVRLLACTVLLCGSVCSAQNAAAPAASANTSAAPATRPAAIDLQDGDTFVFLGDSITHQRLYTQYVEDFFYQRFPDRRIHFHNAGVGGARAWDALARLSDDVLQYRPRYVSILLGMNDGSYRPFDADVFATYQQDMSTLVDRIRAGGAVPLLMSPTMFDARAARSRPNPRRPRSEDMLSQYNSVLAYYGRWLQDQALESGLAYVDMYGRLNDLTRLARSEDPQFTMIRDAIHPDPPGQIVMAYAMIDDLGLRKPLSGIRLEAGASGWKAGASGGAVSKLTATDDGLQFDWQADALPWVLPPEAQPGVDLLKLGHRATKESLEIHGLSPGRYELLIDGTSVGQYTHVALSRHIELQGNSQTPQYQQALQVALLNKQKNEGPVRTLRDSWRLFQSWARRTRDLKSQPGNTQLVQAIAKDESRLATLADTIRAAKAEALAMEDKIYAANQPQLRHFELKKLP